MTKKRYRPILSLLASLAIVGTSVFPAQAIDLLDLEDQLQARQHNVLAGNADVYDVAPGAVFMSGFGSVSRHSNCLAGADCSNRPVTTGNYLWAKQQAPWLVYTSYFGFVQTDTSLHDKGNLSALNVIEVPEHAIRPGGLHVRVFGGGGLSTDLD